MTAAAIPTAAAFVRSPAEAAVALDAFGPPYVVKDDALAAGKGVVVTEDLALAEAHAASCQQVVIEEYLDGPEVSLFAVADGPTAVPLLAAQDFKRAGDGDRGPNTGGMGAYVPLPGPRPAWRTRSWPTVVQPALDELARRGTPYRGLLYAGLALTSARHQGRGVQRALRRPGDAGGAGPAGHPAGRAAARLAAGDLGAVSALDWRPGAAVTVVIAAEGYPEAAGRVTSSPSPVPRGRSRVPAARGNRAGRRRPGDRRGPGAQRGRLGGRPGVGPGRGLHRRGQRPIPRQLVPA